MRAPSSRKAPRKAKRSTRTTTSSKTRKRSTRRRKRKSSDERTDARVFLGLGSNLGNRRSHLDAALAQIERLASLRRVSSFYETDPVGHEDQPTFWNLAAEIVWSGTPEQLLAAAKRIERQIGRKASFANGPREIDIDILDFGGQIRSHPDPILPHPRLGLRRFALAPLWEIAPGWRHPITGMTARQLMRSLPAKPGVRRIRKNW
jgi:2-amino-4-hydroxy-6-hydroxymethyldihydropteridine diphosphokinase